MSCSSRPLRRIVRRLPRSRRGYLILTVYGVAVGCSGDGRCCGCDAVIRSVRRFCLYSGVRYVCDSILSLSSVHISHLKSRGECVCHLNIRGWQAASARPVEVIHVRAIVLT